jgi:hypothetical protein
MKREGIVFDVPQPIEQQLIKGMDLDLRIVVTWDTDVSNVELHGLLQTCFHILTSLNSH